MAPGVRFGPGLTHRAHDRTLPSCQHLSRTHARSQGGMSLPLYIVSDLLYIGHVKNL
jgi:hypothetical protein